MIISLFTLIWYLDLWQNFDTLSRQDEGLVYGTFHLFTMRNSHRLRISLILRSFLLGLLNRVPLGQWQWLVTLIVFTFAPAILFVLIELFRDIKPDGTNAEKPKLENYIEGAIFLLLSLAWIPSVGVATTPGGMASLIGNAFFFTWILVVFVFEGERMLGIGIARCSLMDTTDILVWICRANMVDS